MTINRRDLLRGSGVAAAVAAGGLVPVAARSTRAADKMGPHG